MGMYRSFFMITTREEERIKQIEYLGEEGIRIGWEMRDDSSSSVRLNVSHSGTMYIGIQWTKGNFIPRHSFPSTLSSSWSYNTPQRNWHIPHHILFHPTYRISVVANGLFHLPRRAEKSSMKCKFFQPQWRGYLIEMSLQSFRFKFKGKSYLIL